MPGGFVQPRFIHNPASIINTDYKFLRQLKLKNDYFLSIRAGLWIKHLLDITNFLKYNLLQLLFINCLHSFCVICGPHLSWYSNTCYIYFPLSINVSINFWFINSCALSSSVISDCFRNEEEVTQIQIWSVTLEYTSAS